ncbi:unnamed protein product [Owenia fusiformis]|uniref:Uncharacterized protein n=1 Tax=Owenia fusiformis TaxID=6347 RepID=A0A8J1XSC9_OWEFU|nr:unnamed protein product [Owenia fusiformis]
MIRRKRLKSLVCIVVTAWVYLGLWSLAAIEWLQDDRSILQNNNIFQDNYDVSIRETDDSPDILDSFYMQNSLNEKFITRILTSTTTVKPNTSAKKINDKVKHQRADAILAWRSHLNKVASADFKSTQIPAQNKNTVHYSIKDRIFNLLRIAAIKNPPVGLWDNIYTLINDLHTHQLFDFYLQLDTYTNSHILQNDTLSYLFDMLTTVKKQSENSDTILIVNDILKQLQKLNITIKTPVYKSNDTQDKSSPFRHGATNHTSISTKQVHKIRPKVAHATRATPKLGWAPTRKAKIALQKVSMDWSDEPLVIPEPGYYFYQGINDPVKIPDSVPEEHRWRYRSDILFWNKNDTLYQKWQKWKSKIVFPPESMKREVERVCNELNPMRKKLCDMFKKCYPNTIETTIILLPDSTTYVITGDIPLMWMRDSSAQVFPLLSLAPQDPTVQVLLEGVIRRQIKWIQMDPYGSSYRLFLDFDYMNKKVLTDWDFQSGRTVHVSMHNYEIDSLCYFIRLSYYYWKSVGEDFIFESEWKKAVEIIIDTWITEQYHSSSSSYRYPELPKEGKGTDTCYTGMTWGGFRPSDDKMVFHYNIPANMFVVVSLKQITEIATVVYKDQALADKAIKLAKEIDLGIETYGIILDENYGFMYAYEVNGCERSIKMDDANIPSLLSIPYLGYKPLFDPDGTIYDNTRRFLLSKDNPSYFKGSEVKGIGSPHTGMEKVWHLSLIMQILTTDNLNEIEEALAMIEKGSKDNFMHESFNVDRPGSYTRSWFSWANSLFSEMIIKKLNVVANIEPPPKMSIPVYPTFPSGDIHKNARTTPNKSVDLTGVQILTTGDFYLRSSIRDVVNLDSKLPHYTWKYHNSSTLFWTNRDKLYNKWNSLHANLQGFTSETINKNAITMCNELGPNKEKLCEMYTAALKSTLKRRLVLLPDSTVHVISGDIPVMTLTDSTNQMLPLLNFVSHDKTLQVLIEGVIRRQIKWIMMNPYGSAFRLYVDNYHMNRQALSKVEINYGTTVHTAANNFQLENLCSFINLSYKYWNVVNENEIFDKEWRAAVDIIMQTWLNEQMHNTLSVYTHPSLENRGQGTKVCYTGLIWGGHRPDGFPMAYHYNIPGNMMVIVALRNIAKIASDVLKDNVLENLATELADQIDTAIHNYAVIQIADNVQVYAYEVNGCGDYILMDEASFPNLVSIPFMQYDTKYDPERQLYKNTRAMIFSKQNPFYRTGIAVNGLTSRRDLSEDVWSISLIMRGLTATNTTELQNSLINLQNNMPELALIPEHIQPDGITNKTLPQCEICNSLFAELLLRNISSIKQMNFPQISPVYKVNEEPIITASKELDSDELTTKAVTHGGTDRIANNKNKGIIIDRNANHKYQAGQTVLAARKGNIKNQQGKGELIEKKVQAPPQSKIIKDKKMNHIDEKN